MAAGNRKLIIGLDFGTTFSGVAYCETDANGSARDVNQIQLVTNWPGQGQSNNEKVPSRISYGAPPKHETKWGNLITPKTKSVHALMKLRLDERTKKSKQLQMLLAFLTGNIEGLSLDDMDSDGEDGPPEYPGKDAVDIVADYLTHIREHVWTNLQSQYGEALLDSLDKEVVVTVPAVWSERAKDQTLKAVTRAKFPATKLMLVTEPEAAAIYALKEMQEGARRNEIQTGDNFVLCDAGGGTVDLISYNITQTSPVFKIEEAAIGSGDKCGATYVDKEFLSWLEKWIGSDAYKLIPPEKTRHGSQLMNSFEMLKQHFKGDDDGDMEIRLPRECGIEDDEDLDIDDQVLTLDAAQMRDIFDPCINRTLELIDGQIASILRAGRVKPKMVIVVGGFGRNEYLFKKVTEYCNERGILARQPTFPWSAVSRGAVCRGLEGPMTGLVAVRLARKHYGTPISVPYRAGIHNAVDMYTDEFTGTKYAKGQMRWMVEKGERLPESNPKKASIECCCTFKKSDDREFGAVLVGCDEEVAPKRYADDSAYVICRVRADLSKVPESKFTRARSGLGAEEFLIAEFKLEATFEGGNIDWKFIFDGKEYGSVSVSYDK
ncbi:hypothetical protein BCR34DRAFT_472752 [Clohesyomyces aquaticus]|uniref:Actin-like ATPase domain-containing protein n=1 Tax=Clohesyomyces aquaticus TaxID=1231657 RepID=A0A1Y2A8F5_9PLEO|nr:hypothetical protein BCR34DRAFT_472752 [Clohesyomyces aquaticus]